MADASHQVPFTVGDQERLKGIEDKTDILIGLLQEPFPRCTKNMEKIESLEGTRKNIRRASIGVSVALLVYTLKLIFNHVAVGG